MTEQNGVFFIKQMNKLTIENYSFLSIIKISYYVKIWKPRIHQQFFKRMS